MTTVDTTPRELTSENAEMHAASHGKAEVHLVRVEREGSVHHVSDYTVSSAIRGDLDRIYTHGDNATCVATDTQKNLTFSLARDGVGTPEEFALKFGRFMYSEWPEIVDGGRWEVMKVEWDRIVGDNGPHDFSFVRKGKEERYAVVQAQDEEFKVVAGLKELTVLKSSGSSFVGYPKGTYTTLPETTDRVMSTDVSAWWEYNTLDADWDGIFDSIRHIILSEFAERFSMALQNTMWAIAARIIDTHPEINTVRLQCPNNHHFVVDLEPFGQDNPNVVFYAADRPFGDITAEVVRKGTTPSELAWNTIPSFT